MLFSSPASLSDVMSKYPEILNYLYTHRDDGIVGVETFVSSFSPDKEEHLRKGISALSDAGIIGWDEGAIFLDRDTREWFEKKLGSVGRLNSAYNDIYDEIVEEIRSFVNGGKRTEFHYKKIISCVAGLAQTVELKLDMMTRQKEAIIEMEECEEKDRNINTHYLYQKGVLQFIERLIELLANDPGYKMVLEYRHPQEGMLRNLSSKARSFLSMNALSHVRQDIEDIMLYINARRERSEYNRRIAALFTSLKNGTLEKDTNIIEILGKTTCPMDKVRVYGNIDIHNEEQTETVDSVLRSVAGRINSVAEKNNELPSPIEQELVMKTVMVPNYDFKKIWKSFVKEGGDLYSFVFSLRNPEGKEIPFQHRNAIATNLYMDNFEHLRLIPEKSIEMTIPSKRLGIDVTMAFPFLQHKQEQL